MATHTRVNQDSKEKWAMDVNVANPIEVEVSDIQIGAVEIKNSADDTRAIVKDGNTAGVADDAVLVADANVKVSVDAVNTTLGTPAQETGGNLDTIAVDTTSIDTKITACNTGAVTISSIPDVSITDISKGTQTNDVKVTLDSEVVAVSGTATNTPSSQSSIVLTADGQVKTSAGTVYALLVSGIGVTAGDKIEIKNSTDNTGTALLTIVADGANGTWSFYPCVGITFSTGIYCDETKTGGTFTTTIVYA